LQRDIHCHVTLLKDTTILYNILGIHYNTNQWIEPYKFIPEWFDPASKYYLKPDGGIRSKFAYMPFSFGARACPGQFLALLHIKIFLIFFIKNKAYDWDVNHEELKDMKIATFGLTSEARLKSH